MRSVFYSFTDAAGSSLNFHVTSEGVTISLDSHDGFSAFEAGAGDLKVIRATLADASDMVDSLVPTEDDDVTVEESDTDDLDTYDEDEEEQFDSRHNRF